jgi:hypothetical protein
MTTAQLARRTPETTEKALAFRALDYSDVSSFETIVAAIEEARRLPEDVWPDSHEALDHFYDQLTRLTGGLFEQAVRDGTRPAKIVTELFAREFQQLMDNPKLDQARTDVTSALCDVLGAVSGAPDLEMHALAHAAKALINSYRRENAPQELNITFRPRSRRS